jgi:hypothetical protein
MLYVWIGLGGKIQGFGVLHPLKTTAKGANDTFKVVEAVSVAPKFSALDDVNVKILVSVTLCWKGPKRGGWLKTMS